jgi:hypothetical protein
MKTSKLIKTEKEITTTEMSVEREGSQEYHRKTKLLMTPEEKKAYAAAYELRQKAWKSAKEACIHEGRTDRQLVPIPTTKPPSLLWEEAGEGLSQCCREIVKMETPRPDGQPVRTALYRQAIDETHTYLDKMTADKSFNKTEKLIVLSYVFTDIKCVERDPKAPKKTEEEIRQEERELARKEMATEEFNEGDENTKKRLAAKYPSWFPEYVAQPEEDAEEAAPKEAAPKKEKKSKK